MIEMKLDDIQKVKKKKEEERQVVQAKECIKVGDLYVQSGRLSDALKQFNQALNLSRD